MHHVYKHTASPKKLETGLRTNCAGIPFTLLLRIGAPKWGLLGFQLLGVYSKGSGFGVTVYLEVHG